MPTLSPPGVSAGEPPVRGPVLCFRPLTARGVVFREIPPCVRPFVDRCLLPGLPACSSIKMPNIWPFYKKPKPAPEAVNELNLVNADGSPASFPQYWKRNTLVIDLSGVGGAGNVAARLPEETTWPVRVAVRVRPGSVGRSRSRAKSATCCPSATEGTRPSTSNSRPACTRRRRRLSTFPGGRCRRSWRRRRSKRLPHSCHRRKCRKPSRIGAGGSRPRRERHHPARRSAAAQPSPPPGT